jgi:hypothetical protein
VEAKGILFLFFFENPSSLKSFPKQGLDLEIENGEEEVNINAF